MPRPALSRPPFAPRSLQASIALLEAVVGTRALAGGAPPGGAPAAARRGFVCAPGGKMRVDVSARALREGGACRVHIIRARDYFEQASCVARAAGAFGRAGRG